MKLCETQRTETQYAETHMPGRGLRRPMLQRLTLSLISLSFVGVMATGCSDIRRAIGSEKSAPDEFEVVVRPPLSLPPSFGADAAALTSGASATPATDVAGDAQSRAASVFGAAEGRATEGYGQLFDFAAVPENIRETIDEETYGIRFERRLPLEKLFGGLPDIGPVLDKVAEDQRLRQNLREGRLPVEGATPAVDVQTEEPVTVGD